MIFDKVVQESSGKSVDLKTSLEEKLRQRKMQEMDDAVIESTVQATRTRTADLEAKEVEAQSRKVNAEASIMDKFMPQGVWALLAEVLKNKGPQENLTVQDMLTILEYARGQEGTGPPADQPSEGMWGFLSTMMTTLMAQNKTTTPLELVQTMQTLSSMNQPPAPQSGGMFAQLTEFANLAQTFRTLFGPAPNQNGNPAALVEMPGGGHMTLEQIMQWQNHGFDLQLKRDEHDEKIKNWQAARENAPGFIDAIKEFAATLRGEVETKPGSGAKRIYYEPHGKKPSEKEVINRVGKQAEMQELQCPDCKLPFSLPADVDEEVACPRCSMTILKRLEAAGNAGKLNPEGGKGESLSEQGEDKGGSKVDLP